MDGEEILVSVNGVSGGGGDPGSGLAGQGVEEEGVHAHPAEEDAASVAKIPNCYGGLAVKSATTCALLSSTTKRADVQFHIG